MREAKAREGGGIVEDCGLVLGGEAGREGIAGLCGGSVHTVDKWWNRCWGRCRRRGWRQRVRGDEGCAGVERWEKCQSFVGSGRSGRLTCHGCDGV